LYSNAFMPSVAVLEWQLVGDVLKFSSWTLGFLILARAGSVWYFATELCAGAVSLLANLWGVRYFGLPGVGIAFVLTYAAYWLIVVFVVRIRFGWTLVWQNLVWVFFGFVLAGTVGLLSHFQLTFLHAWVGAVASVVTAVFSVFSFMKGMRHSIPVVVRLPG
jgi:hypothetical protein